MASSANLSFLLPCRTSAESISRLVSRTDSGDDPIPQIRVQGFRDSSVPLSEMRLERLSGGLFWKPFTKGNDHGANNLDSNVSTGICESSREAERFGGG